MKKFCEDLRKHATKIINYDKKKMIPLTIEENKSYYEQKSLLYMEQENLALIIKNNKKSDIIVIIVGNIEAVLIIL